MLLDLSSGTTASDTMADPPEAVTVAGPAEARGAVSVTSAAALVAVHTYRLPGEGSLEFPAGWFEAGDDVDAERWVE